MFNLTNKDEQLHLKTILNKINLKLKKNQDSIKDYSSEIIEAKRYVWENIYEMDPMEIISNDQSIELTINSAETIIEEIRKQKKQIKSPYFGRIDFTFPNEKDATPIYIGIYSFTDTEQYDILIYDWRAPISSMFYDFEKGNAYYETPSGRINGNILLKRQYEIKNSKLEYFFESSLKINDEILQRELGKTSDHKMKSIVMTIQKEQNIIIRDVSTNVLVIQGVAGSGKTSIALHRVAFLLYKLKDQLKSTNVLIVSPNKIFADYISTILPELGEQKILEVSLHEIAENELEKKQKFETFYEQVQYLLEEEDPQYEKRIIFKSNNSFLTKIDDFISMVEKSYFNPKKIKIGEIEISSEYLLGRYKAYSKTPIISRLSKITNDITELMENQHNYKINKSIQRLIHKKLLSMFKTTDILEIYKNFFKYLEKEEMLYLKSKNILEYADVFPVIYLKMHLLYSNDFSHIKHLIVDEMQDYNVIQYAVLSKMFNCKKTILGDINQSINPFNSCNSEIIASMFENSKIINLFKSYRSTYEIINFAQRIINNKDLISVERHGIEPEIIKYKKGEDILDKIIKEFQRSNYESFGIICKTQEQAKKTFETISKMHQQVSLLNYESKEFKSGIIVTTAYISKGLEFDQVLIVDCDSKNYKTITDKGMLYVSCTRAIHKLDLIYVNELTNLILL